MSKGLEALEKLDDCHCCFATNREYELFSIIKNELEQLEKYKAIDEKLGCPLEVYFQIIKTGIWVCNEFTKNKMEHWYPQEIKIIDAGGQIDICHITSRENTWVMTENYTKTWWLKGDKSE